MPAFPTTRWSLIRATGAARPPQDIAAAWALLVRDYRPALVAYFRRSALARDAEDLAQEFLAHSLQDSWWARADAEAGTFRRFLLALLRRFLANRLASARQRGEVLTDELPEQVSAQSPETEFDLQFAHCLAQAALQQLRERYARDGKAALFAQLEPWLAETPENGDIATIAKSMNVEPNTLAVQLRRLRLRFRDSFAARHAQLCLDPAQADAEAAALRQALATHG
jgi:hypothetical protein